MVSLKEKVEKNFITNEEILDIGVSLCMLIANNSCNAILSPENIIVLKQNEVEIIEGKFDNLVFAAPEVIFEEKINNQDAQWFSFGLILYYMLTKKDYYLNNSKLVLSIPKMKFNQKSLVLSDELKGFPLADIVEKLTAWNPEERKRGVTLFVDYMSTIESEYEIGFYTGEDCIKTMIGTNKDSFDITTTELIYGKEEKLYHVVSNVHIPYRPGKHKYKVEVK